MKNRYILYICVVFSILMFTSCSDTDTYYVTAEKGLNVRATPSAKGKVIGKLQYLDDIEVISIEGNWAKIEYEKSEAYVSSQHISEDDSTVAGVIVFILFTLFILGGGGTVAAVHLKKDGTPDRRFKSNR